MIFLLIVFKGFEIKLIKVIHKDVKPFLNETVKEIYFHVDL